MLPVEFMTLAIALRLASGAQYTWAVLKGRARPNPITWFFWGLTALIAFFAQLSQGVGLPSFITLALAVGPFTVCFISVAKGHLRAHLNPFNFICMAITVIGIVLWITTKNANLAILFSIIADASISLPTLVKGYRDPRSEYAYPYLLSVFSLGITLLMITDWRFAAYGFPLYMLLINLALFSMPFIGRRQSKKVR